jgi:hypothetical protein
MRGGQGFLRQLSTPLPEEERENLFGMLTKTGIEVYGRKSADGEFKLLGNSEESADGVFYVSAADREEAVRMMELLSLSGYVSENNKVMSEEEAFAERAEEEYFRKRRVTMLECLVVILAALLFYLIRTWT